MKFEQKTQPYFGYVAFDGWDYLLAPPADILDVSYLSHDDPWMILCCILERAKLGDFSLTMKLHPLCYSTNSDICLTAKYLMAAIGTSEEIQIFSKKILGESRWRMETADYATLTGSLQFLQTFIDGYRIAFGETTRMAMEDGLSNLLMTDPEDLFVMDCLGANPKEGEENLKRAGREQAKRFGKKTSFLNGVPFSLKALADEADSLISEEDRDESFESIRSSLTKLQTALGFSQRGMFDEDDRSFDEALIREQLAVARSFDGVDGVRYFFGHPTPL